MLQVDDESAPNFMADFCAEDRLDEPVPDGESIQLREKRQLPTTPPTPSVFNPLLTEGVWAPDLTLMYAPQFSDQVSVTKLCRAIEAAYYKIIFSQMNFFEFDFVQSFTRKKLF